jgi:uncharacterized membrane protein YvbJ
LDLRRKDIMDATLIQIILALIGCLLAVIGFFLIRTLQQNDKALEKLNTVVHNLDKTVADFRLDIKDRPTWEAVKIIATEEALSAVKDHVVNVHIH